MIMRLLEQGHTVTLPLRGESMRPFLRDGRDKALLVKAKGISRYDAVLARIEQDRYVLHRVVKIDGDDITLRGDGNLATEHCKRGDIIAFVVGFYRKGSGKIDKTNGWKWTLYSAAWQLLLPFRRYILGAMRRLGC